MDRLSAEDTRILRLESEAIAGHTMKLAITEPGPDGPPVTVDRLRERVEMRLGTLPRARQRLAPTPLRVAPPAWVDDEGFDIRH
ncbi:MAG TPA: wax ester/triacylglycerol synthase domain-containing protein, partial [Solirubrobacterales bacterium]